MYYWPNLQRINSEKPKGETARATPKAHCNVINLGAQSYGPRITIPYQTGMFKMMQREKRRSFSLETNKGSKTYKCKIFSF
jgi:hypothetical protein